MAPKLKIRINMSTQSLSKMAGLVANSVLLASNTYLVVSSLQEQLRDRRRQRLVGGFQVASEIAGALAALVKVISESVEQHHGP